MSQAKEEFRQLALATSHDFKLPPIRETVHSSASSPNPTSSFGQKTATTHLSRCNKKLYNAEVIYPIKQ